MSNTRNITYALAAVGVVLIGSQVSLRFVGNQAIAQGGPPAGIVGNVTVTNTPLPVTVTNPTVPPSTINVGNPAALAAANAQALRVGTPVWFVLSSQSNPPKSYSVPLGKLLIMEYISVTCAPAPVSALTGITFVTGGQSAEHAFPAPFARDIPGQTTIGASSNSVKIFADGGTTVTPAPANSALCLLNVSGQLVTP